MGKALTKGGPHPAFIAGQITEYRYFFLNLTPSPKSELTVACGGWERCAPDYQVERADLEFYGIEYVAHGKGLLIMDGIEHKLIPGSVFAYQPFTAHTIRTNPDDPLVKYFIDFSGQAAQEISSRKVFGTQGVAYLHRSQPVHELYEQSLETGLKGGVMAPQICSLLLELLALRISEHAQIPSHAHGRARQSFERCQTEMQKNFRTIHSVAELARMTHFEPAYLSRLFYRFAGESPYEMLTRLKMSEAASHLIGGHYTVKELAGQVGFSDPYHFSRAFKKHFGISPSQFQHSHTRRYSA
jgi:AraC-like DNA-binding protein